jgi:hypothetical protein
LQSRIDNLESEITNLNKQVEQNSAKANNSISFTGLAKDAKIRFNDLQYFSYAEMLESKDFIKIDTLSVANVRWNSSLNDSLKLIKEKELSIWLKQAIKVDTIVIKRN